MIQPNPEKIVMVGDFGKDLDDENALLYAVGNEKRGDSQLLAVVANLDPASQRARLAKGMLDLLDIGVPVGVGTACNRLDSPGQYETDVPYLSDEVEKTGAKLLKEVLDNAESNSITFILNSGLTDAAELVCREPDLFKKKVARVAIMGGVLLRGNEVKVDQSGRFLPDDSANNQFDPSAANFIYSWLQTEGVPMSVLTRTAAYACKFDTEFYDRLAQQPGPIGPHIRERQQKAFSHLWQAAISPLGSDFRGALPDRCDREWFVDTYLGGQDPVEDDGNIGNLVRTVQLYDPLNVASVLRPELFSPHFVTVKNVEHQIIGISPERHGISYPDVLRKHITSTIIDSLQI